MKIRIVTLIFLLLSFSNLKAQYQSLFGNSQTSWNISVHIHVPFPTYLTDSLTYTGDTILNGMDYRIIESEMIDENGNGLLGNGVYGFIREDTIQGKGWFRNRYGSPVDFQFYNMSLNVGDSFYIDGLYGGWFPVDSVYFLSGRKHVQLDYFHTAGYIGRMTLFTTGPHVFSEKLTFIEGIGTNFSFYYLGDGVWRNDHVLLCSHKDNQIVFQQNYQDTFYTGCNTFRDPTIGIEIPLGVSNDFILYPNPVSELLNVRSNSQTSPISFITITTLSGKQILQTTQTEIPVSHLSKGLYFARVEFTNGQSAVRKVVVQ